jgi:hypothetical protein
MSEPRGDDRFVDETLRRLARQERRLPVLIAGLLAVALVLAVPAAVILRASAAIDVGTDLGWALVVEVVSGALHNPVFYAGLALALGWLAWLGRGLRRRGA